MAHGPNVEAVNAILLDILPQMEQYLRVIAQKAPNVTFSVNIIGANLMVDAELRKRFQHVHFFPNMEQDQVQ